MRLFLLQAVVSAVETSVQEDLKAQVIEGGLENHTTQGCHGVNYHHPESGSSGYQFFMPTRELLHMCLRGIQG